MRDNTKIQSVNILFNDSACLSCCVELLDSLPELDLQETEF